jgi:predicted TIM-barrel enzyme
VPEIDALTDIANAYGLTLARVQQLHQAYLASSGIDRPLARELIDELDQVMRS